MNKNHFLGIAIFLMLTMIACKSTKSNTSYDPLILNCWKHSYEEDKDGYKIYRPCNFKKFPISRYRNEFTLSENTKSSYLVLSPNDAHYKEEGKWIYSSDRKTLLIQNKNGVAKWKFELVELTKDEMKLKQIK